MDETTVNSKAASLLLQKFKEGQLRNPRWSQRAFARRLGISSGALSEILQGKRALSPQLKKKFASVLQLSPSEQLDFFEDDLPAHLKPARHEYLRLSVDQFHLISDWWHYAILNLVKTKGFKPDPAWIAGRLDLPAKIVTEAWERLLRLGHLKKSGNRVVREHPRLETGDDFFDLSIRRSHVEDTRLIEKSVLNGAIDRRDHTSMTVVMNRKSMARAKEMIRLFQDQFSEEIEAASGGPAEEVYRLSISFFPLTKIEEKT